MSDQEFPSGRDEARVRRLISHYEVLDEESLIAEDEAAEVIRLATNVYEGLSQNEIDEIERIALDRGNRFSNSEMPSDRVEKHEDAQ